MAKKKVIKKFTPPVKTNKSILITFDGDKEDCGLSLYDVAKDEVLYFESIDYNLIRDKIDELIEEYGKIRMVARIEIATYGTAVGASKKAAVKDRNKIIYQSGRSSMTGLLFKRLMESYNIPIIVVESSKRKNMSEYKDLTYSQVRPHVVAAMSKGYYPSKLTASQLKGFFPMLKKGGNPESRDALALAIPERMNNAARKNLLKR